MSLEVLHNKIYQVRGHNVMLDFEIAEMFEVETRTMNQSVKRNLERFPEDFMFQLTKEEWLFLISQIVISKESLSQHTISKKETRGGTQKLPYVFTEHGVTMLASVLRSERAVKVSIAVVRAFISLKKFIAENKNISKQLQEVKDALSERIDQQDVQILEIYQALDKLISDKEEEKHITREPIGFKQKQDKKNNIF